MAGRLLRALLGMAVFALIFFAAGEVLLRWYFVEGESFTSHGGPIVERFERDFVFNRFDGPSRGPEAAGEKSAGEVRVLVLGDSITWGQGVRHEEDLYTSRLLEQLRRDLPNVEMAVLAYPGREVDDHLEQLDRWGAALAPDVIIYQWFVNDLELSHQGRPGSRGRVWRRLPFHRKMLDSSYLWFFFDFSMNRVLPSGSALSYEEYLMEDYAADTAKWQAAAEVFRTWLRHARSLTPNVLVALYPMVGPDGERALSPVYDQFEHLCEIEGVEAIDLWGSLRPLAKEKRLSSSPYDSHPGAAAHAAIAEALHDQLLRGNLIPRG